MGVDESSMFYREGRLKRRLRKCLASKEARAGLSKDDSWRERLVMRICCVMAVVYFLLAMLFTPVSQLLWAQALCMALCVLWCALAGLYETASEWQRQATLTAASRDAKVSRLLEGGDGLSDRDAIEMADSAMDFRHATGEDVAEALREELGGE